MAGKESALWTLREGKVVRYQGFHEPTEALEAAVLAVQDAHADS